MSPISPETLSPILKTILPKINQHKQSSKTPYILAITGPQGSGKTTWSQALQQILSEEYNLLTISLSLDDLYYTHDDLVRVREEDMENALYRTRGQPGTHDESLGAAFFESLRDGGEVCIPAFDKSAFGGEGDRVPVEKWERIEHGRSVDVCIFEGWCLGFRSLPPSDVERKWRYAKDDIGAGEKVKCAGGFEVPASTLSQHRLCDLLLMNENLKRYNDTFMGPRWFDFMIHLDSVRLYDVYAWRVEAERKMIEERGMGMDDDVVIRFVEGYMPGYELYLDELKSRPYFEGVDQKGKGQIKVVLGTDRRIVDMKGIQDES